MLYFDKEQIILLRKDAEEIRNCITTYISYIVGIAGVSSFVSNLFSDKIPSNNKLFFIVFVLIVITLIFEIIWYKFKSHNRYTGYIQLLSQEEAFIHFDELSQSDIIKKRYITNYKYFASKSQKKHKNIPQDISSWNVMISRISDNDFHKYDYSEKLKVQSILKSTKKHKFVFGINNTYYKYIKVNNYDQKFFKDIILKLYLIRPNDNYSFIRKIIKTFHTKFLYLFSKETEKVIDDFGIDKRYIATGWKYPKKVTQIGFISVILLILTILWFIKLDYELISISDISLNLLKNEANISLLIALIIFAFWLFRYVFGIKEIMYGKYSIDGYCWHFFTYRIQYLNNTKNIIPIYFSRNFYRFFKTNLYIRYLENYIKNSNSDRIEQLSFITERMFNIYKKRYNEKYNEISKKILDKNSNYQYNKKDFIDYVNKLLSYKEFNPQERLIHNIIINCFKTYNVKNKG